MTANSRYFNVSWTAGAGNDGAGGCKLQVLVNGYWYDIDSANSVNCDANANNTQYTLNGDGWWWGSQWVNLPQVNLVRKSDSAVMGTLGYLSCHPKDGSDDPTPDVDENCDGRWDDTGLGHHDEPGCESGMCVNEQDYDSSDCSGDKGGSWGPECVDGQSLGCNTYNQNSSADLSSSDDCSHTVYGGTIYY